MNIYKKLANIQKDLFVPKGQRNDFGKYNYRSCEDILKTVKPLCEENNCVLYLTNEIVEIGNRNYVEAIARLVDLETGEIVESKAHAREDENKKGSDGSQITGSSSSYARKYALAGLFSIDNEKDFDATNDGKNENKKVDETKYKLEVMKLFTGKSEEYKKGICEHYNINDVSEMTLEQCKDFIEKINSKKGAK